MCPNECTNVILSRLDRRSQMHFVYFVSFRSERGRGSSLIPIILSSRQDRNAESSSSINVRVRDEVICLS